MSTLLGDLVEHRYFGKTSWYFLGYIAIMEYMLPIINTMFDKKIGIVIHLYCMTVRMRSTKGKRNTRRSHHSITLPVQVPEGDVLRIRHYASRITGTYRNRSVVPVAEKQEKTRKNRAEQTSDEKKTVEQVAIPPVPSREG